MIDDLEKIEGTIKGIQSDTVEVNKKIADLQNKIEGTIKGMQSDTDELNKKIEAIQNLPFINVCGYKYKVNYNSKTITYDKSLLSSTNTMGGGLDISTGVFAAPSSGDYTISYHMMANDNPWDAAVSIYLYKNTQQITESLFTSRYSKGVGQVDEQGK